MSQEELLIVFVKNAELGKVKTRLARTIGDEEALWIYNELLKHTSEQTQDLDCNVWVYYSQFPEPDDEFKIQNQNKFTQVGEGLGEKMKNAFEQAFKKGYKKVNLIGSDCIDINSEILNQAFELLKQNKIVFGPSLDGGYYLVGMSEFSPHIFDEIEWSTEHVLNQSLNRLKPKEHALLTKLRDIDTIEDLENYPDWMNRLKNVSF